MHPLKLVLGAFVSFWLGLLVHPWFFAAAGVFAVLYVINVIDFLFS